MLKVLYYDVLKFQPRNIKLLNDNFETVKLNDPREDSDRLLKSVDVSFAPLGFYFGKEKMDKMSNLKAIVSNTTGEPHIDREYAERKGIKVVSLKYEQEFLKTITPTAEHTWGLILALTRRTPWAHQSTLKGKWDRRPFGGKAMLSKMTIGIVGLGRLGSMVADYAKAFKMEKILFYDPFVESPEPDKVVKTESLEELVANVDIVTLHVPAEKETHKLFNEEIFSKFKKGSFFINTSRGEIVDERAMLNALKSGHLVGVAIDVFDGEYETIHKKLWCKNPLLKYARSHDNLLVTPHIGGSTLDAWYLTEEYVIRKVISEVL